MVCDLSATTERIAVGNKFPLTESASANPGKADEPSPRPSRSIEYVRYCPDKLNQCPLSGVKRTSRARSDFQSRTNFVSDTEDVFLFLHFLFKDLTQNQE